MAGRSHHEAAAKARRLLVCAVVAVAGLLCLPSLAAADYEQVPEHFGVGTGEPEALFRSQAMAVNSGGAGGVEAGSIYVGGFTGRVLRFSAGSEGEAPQFREAWGWNVGSGGAGEFQRCGPAYAAEPRPAHTFPTCLPVGSVEGGEQVGNFTPIAGLAVDEATGNVYVLTSNTDSPPHEHHLIQVFTATGTPIGEGFGDLGRRNPFPSESIAEGPEKLHDHAMPQEGGIAVDEVGTVYVTDYEFANAPGPFQSRVMSFQPETAGDYEHYVYAGQSKDITTTESTRFRQVALIGPDRLVTSSAQSIREYQIGGGSTPICSLKVSGGQPVGLAANPLTGEVFYDIEATQSKLRRLGPCDEASGEFEELQEAIVPAPEGEALRALAVNPSLAWGPRRPVGVLYGAAAELFGAPGKGIGYVFAPAEGFPPTIKSESVTGTTATSSTLQALIDPRNQTTRYAFQYLTRAQYEANEPDERQSLTVSAGGGAFGLGFKGQGLGGVATGSLTAGSPAVTSLVTAAGTADLHAAKGTATLKGAVGKGTVISGSAVVTAATAAEGAFSSGQTITGTGIPAGTTIVTVSGSELTLSAAATESHANTSLNAGTTALTAVATTEGEFKFGMLIEGVGIPPQTTIAAISGTKITLSKPTTKPGTGVEIKAGSTTLDGLSTSEGTFVVGQSLTGEGIPSGTTIIAVQPGELQISEAPTKPGTGIAITSSGPAPLAVGEVVEGPGISPGTTIVFAAAGELTLSQPATATASGVQLRAGLHFDASAAEVQSALEGLASIGKGGVKVSGGPGDEVGSSPYEVEFTGFPNQDVPQMEADASGLIGGAASAAVATTHQGGGGFSQGATEAPLGGGELPGNSVGTASVGVAGLSPETGYRFRVIVSSECNGAGVPPCEALGAPASFTTYPAATAGLPDGRAYELVSPAQKHGGEVFPADSFISSCLSECKPPGGGTSSVFPMQSAPDGNAVSYMGFPFSPDEGAATFNSYVSRRTASGWQTTAMSPRRLSNGSDLAYSDSLGKGAIITRHRDALAEGAPAGNNVYLQDAGDPAALRPLLTEALFEAHPPHHELVSLELRYAGHSPDFSRQFFAANDALTGATAHAPPAPEVNIAEFNLYEWSEAEGVALVGVLPGGSAASGATFASASPDANGVSGDGSKVFFEAGGHLYARIDGSRTLEVATGKFLSANPAGSEVVLADGRIEELNGAGSAYEQAGDLTQGNGGFLGIAGQSQDLSRIYFVDSAALPGKNSEEEEAEPGKPNLYLYESGVGTRFIATLLASDGTGAVSTFNDWASAPGVRTAEASPDGRYLAFGSTSPLTGYGNVGPCDAVPSGTGNVLVLVSAPCKEVFLYDSTTGRLTCPSCNPTGEAPLGNSTLRLITGAGIRPWLPQPRYLTDSGRLFFDSSDRLTPRDTNGRVEDVYESEPQGLGSCVRPGGCVTLISSGAGSVDSNFLAMGGEGEGSDVFFTTRDELVPKDTDELLDLYDARIGGGFASETETQRAECQGESCQPVSQAPNDATPASSAFHGAGNVKPQKPKRCPKGKVRRSGRCVKKKKAPRATHPNRGGAK